MFFTDPATTPGSGWQRARTVWALRNLLGSDDKVGLVCQTFRGWSDFAAAPAAQRVHMLGPSFAHVPDSPPPVPSLPSGVDVLGRYEEGYPFALARQAPPSVVFREGTLPVGLRLAVAAATSASPIGVEVARSAGLAAAEAGVPLVVSLRPGAQSDAARMCLDAGGTVILVAAHGLDVTSIAQSLISRAVDAGGAVVSLADPTTPATSASSALADRAAAWLADVVLLAEVGVSADTCSHAAAAAVGEGKALLVPAPGVVTPRRSSAEGTRIFSHPSSWDPGPFGSSGRIESRVAAGHPPADLVIESVPQLVAALRVAAARR